ncbi:GMC oxidoreductase [Pseudomonas sp. GW531-T4]|uniref:GMC oxidoreductase n=1 Tax=Pseudomonas sp. GW531-T4 TaxID=2075553 RepID=UPI000CD1D203|nr:GMC family oxidoreductase [Pseudomonas sp. GW531-T4]POA74910.1 GMC family oxidoreductase [Pseudomonas sp. GW531-T4]
MKTDATFVVVGSGGGGGTIAWLLARAGYKVLLLEQGPDFAKDKRNDKLDFDPSLHDEHYFRLRKPDPKRRLRGDYNTFMERDKDAAALPFGGGWTGSIVGGGSVLWGTWAFRALPIDFRLKSYYERTKEFDGLKNAGYSIVDWPISYSEMLPFYTVAEAMMGVSGDRSAVNESIRNSCWFKHLQDIGMAGSEEEWFPKHPYPMPAYPMTPVGHLVATGMAAASKIKMKAFSTPVAIVKPGSPGLKTRDAIAAALATKEGAVGGVSPWTAKADAIWSDQVRQACNMCGFCGEYLCWGRTGPKWGTQDTVLREHLDQLTVRPNAKVVEILYDTASKRATGVAYLDLGDPDHPHRREVSADYVIVSCGAVQSARLLLMSGPPAGLGNSTDQVGRNATFHLFGLGTKITLNPDYDGLLHGEFGPTGNQSTFGTYFIPGESGSWIKAGHTTSTAKKNPLEDAIGAVNRDSKIGRGLIDAMAEHNRKLEVRLTADDLPMPSNRVTLDPTYVDEYGVPVARIARKFGDNELRLFKAARAPLESIFTDRPNWQGVFKKDSMVTTDADVKLIGDHQMGTCRMGDDPKSSVVNRFCRLHDTPNVFVVDSSFMPTGLGLNPMVTVVANALRVGTHIVDRLAKGQVPGTP